MNTGLLTYLLKHKPTKMVLGLIALTISAGLLLSGCDENGLRLSTTSTNNEEEKADLSPKLPVENNYRTFEYENGYVLFVNYRQVPNTYWQLRGKMKVSHFSKSILVEKEDGSTYIIPFESLVYVGSQEIQG